MIIKLVVALACLIVAIACVIDGDYVHGTELAALSIILRELK